MGLGKYVKDHYDKDLTAVNDIIVIKKHELYRERMFGGIHIADISQSPGHNLTKGEVVSIGPDAEFEGLKVGDNVMYDHFAGHYLTDPIVCVSVENVICVYEDDEETK